MSAAKKYSWPRQHLLALCAQYPPPKPIVPTRTRGDRGAADCRVPTPCSSVLLSPRPTSANVLHRLLLSDRRTPPNTVISSSPALSFLHSACNTLETRPYGLTQPWTAHRLHRLRTVPIPRPQAVVMPLQTAAAVCLQETTTYSSYRHTRRVAASSTCPAWASSGIASWQGLEAP